MLKYTPFFKVLEHILYDAWTDLELDFEEKLSVGTDESLSLSLTYHRIYKGKDSGEVLSYRLGHCDDEDAGRRASEGTPPELDQIMKKMNSAESREKVILFSIFKERMKFVYEKMKSELKNKKNAKEELERVKLIINEGSQKFLEVANENYPNAFPKDWSEHQEIERANLAENARLLGEQQEDPHHDPEYDPEYAIRMRFI